MAQLIERYPWLVDLMLWSIPLIAIAAAAIWL